MEYTEKAFRKTFTNEKRKEAYMAACKWLATNIISKKNELSDFLFKIDEVKNTKDPTFELVLFVKLDESVLRERHCAICKEASSLFYMNDEADCSHCNMLAYTKRMDEMISQKKIHFSSRLKGV